MLHWKVRNNRYWGSPSSVRNINRYYPVTSCMLYLPWRILTASFPSEIFCDVFPFLYASTNAAFHFSKHVRPVLECKHRLLSVSILYYCLTELISTAVKRKGGKHQTKHRTAILALRYQPTYQLGWKRNLAQTENPIPALWQILFIVQMLTVVRVKDEALVLLWSSYSLIKNIEK